MVVTMPHHASANIVGDTDRGQMLFAKCRTCHYPEKIVGHSNGPNLHDIFNKRAGSQPGFDYYSDELKQMGFIWTPELLDIWLANGEKFLPNSTMMFLTIGEAQDRADIIAYLQQFTEE